MGKLSFLNCGIVICCMIGVGLSCYAYFVESKAEHNENYQAMCDISEHVSCTKVFKSKYGKGFGIVERYFGEDSDLNKPNSIGGMILYPLLACLCLINSITSTRIIVGFCIVANLGSVYLAYILYYILHNLCVICVGIYSVNFMILVFSILKLRLLKASISQSSPAKKKKKTN